MTTDTSDTSHVLITGATGDLGRAIAEGFLDRGARLALQYRRSPEPLAPLVARAEAAGREILLLQADLTTPEGPAGLVERVEKEWGRLDVLVNNAGGASPRSFADVTLQEWQEALQLNLTAPFLLVQAALPLLTASRGAVVNISSVAALTGGAFGPHYAATKAGLIGLTRSAARELGPLGIRVNALAPGPVDSAMTDKLAGPVMAGITASTALRRVVRPQEIADAVTWLADAAGAVTGQTLVVDGGRHFL
ncbi:SDR family oxidoreductase [Kitasatospora sp. MAA4]|uniref:SDR family NAD(P)-dependent oxidoreductase n=1 Tax=Kitasatospora sp. MAA4 TaxID=3035093 RepID=UPI002474C0E6|nr:SDR family oxidoreductase [Kitasatospora sp. MAA4]